MRLHLALRGMGGDTCTYHRLQGGSRHHGIGELHLLGQHGHVLLLDQVIAPIDLQLRF